MKNRRQTQEVKRKAKIETALKSLRNKNWFVRCHAVCTLNGLEAKEYTKDISRALKDKNKDVRNSAIWALGEFQAKEYAKDIAELLKDKDKYIRASAIFALEKLVARRYARDIAKLLRDNSKFDIYDKVKKGLIKSTIYKVAEQVLRNWGYDPEKLKLQEGNK